MNAMGETLKIVASFIVARRDYGLGQVLLAEVAQPTILSCGLRERYDPCEAVAPKPWGHS